MLMNAKKVEKKHTNRFASDLLDDGFIPGQALDEYLDGVDSKFKAFSRKQEEEFVSSFGEKYSQYRQQCYKRWRKIDPEEYNDTHFPGWASLRGNNIGFDERWFLMGVTKNMEMVYEKNIHLPMLNYRELAMTQYQELLAFSGKLPFKPDFIRDGSLDYINTHSLKWAWVYTDELDELKHIYEQWWHSNQCRQLWLRSMYNMEMKHSKKILDRSSDIYVLPDGLRRPTYNTVVAQYNGTMYVTTVDELYEWICWSRLHVEEPKDWAIGEVGNALLFTYGFWTYLAGGSKIAIMNSMTEDMVLQILSEVMTDASEWISKQQQALWETGSVSDDGSSLPSWLDRIRSQKIFPDRLFDELHFYEDGLFESDYEPAWTKRRVDLKVRFNLADLENAEDSGMSSSEESAVSRVSSDIFGIHQQEELPYEPGTFEDDVGDEYVIDDDEVASDADNSHQVYDEGFAGENTWDGPGPSIDHASDVDADDLEPPRQLTAVEELGIDLVDPRVYTTPVNTTLGKVAQVWRPRVNKLPYTYSAAFMRLRKRRRPPD